MTREEVAALIEQIPQGIHVDEFIVMLATKAAEYEREECAKVCDQIYRVWLDCDPEDEYKTLQDAEDCAAAIRSRK